MPESQPFNPLHDKYPELHNSPEVMAAVARHEDPRNEGEPLRQPSEKLDAWMDTLEHIHIGRDEATAQRIKDVYHKQYVMRPDQVPESYFELQKRIAREQGHGNVEIPPAVRREMSETITRDQERSLDAWIDYLSSSDAAYPMWFKYYAFRNITKLADFDKDKGEFKKRSKSTTAPFPDINREALAYMADALANQYHIKDHNQDGVPTEIDPETKALLESDANFAKLYAHAIEKIHPASAEELAITDGQWVKYDQGTDGTILARTLQGHGTGWCTAGEGTAQAQLNEGDFYVYYTKNAQGEYVVPRVAIRMQGEKIGEVRGIQANQNLEPALVEIARTKMAELPGAQEYEQKAADMQQLTAIEQKVKADQELSVQELRFLYQLDRQIKGFGYDSDPRIDELTVGRDWLTDMSTIYGTTDHTQLTNRLIDEGRGNAVASNLDKFQGLDVSIAIRLLDEGQDKPVADNLDKFQGLDASIATRLINEELGGAVASNLDKFQGLDRMQLANRLLDTGQGYAIADNLDEFPGLDHIQLASRLLDTGWGIAVAYNLDKFQGLDHTQIANRLVDEGTGSTVAYNLDKFQGLDRMQLANRLLDTGQGNDVANNLDKFQGLDRMQLANRLLDEGLGYALAYNLDEFPGLDHIQLANRLLDSGQGYAIAENLDKFQGTTENMIARALANRS